MTPEHLTLIAFACGALVTAGVLAYPLVTLKRERDGHREAAMQLAFERDRSTRTIKGLRQELSNLRTAITAGDKRGPNWTYGQHAGRN